MADATVDFADLRCLRCQQTMNYLGQMPLRSGGTSGGWNFLFGPWAALGEQVIKIDAYRCSNCGHLELFDLDMIFSEVPPQEPEIEQE